MSHHDVGNDFYSLVLGPSMVYSCAYFEKPAGPGSPLEQARRAKLSLVARKLGLCPGMRVLDVGCGWGSFVVHAARHHGVEAVGVTLSREQAAWARDRAGAEGLADQVEIRVQDNRKVADGPFDAIASIGMTEHVGRAQLAAYAEHLRGLLAPAAGCSTTPSPAPRGCHLTGEGGPRPSSNASRRGRLGVNQVLAVRPG